MKADAGQSIINILNVANKIEIVFRRSRAIMISSSHPIEKANSLNLIMRLFSVAKVIVRNFNQQIQVNLKALQFINQRIHE